MAKRDLFSFGFGKGFDKSGPPTKKEREEQKQNYEKGRKRKFIPKWKDDYEWLSYDEDSGKMFCQPCKDSPESSANRSFIDGTDSFRLQNIISHDTSSYHKSSVIRYQTKNKMSVQTNFKGDSCIETVAGGSFDWGQKASCSSSLSSPPGVIGPMDHAIKALNEKQHDQLIACFNTAYFVAKNELPFTMYPSILKLQAKNGITLPQSYQSDQACRRFIKFIHEDSFTRTHQEINNARVISIMFDGATDVSTSENEVIYARLLEDGLATDVYVKLEAVEHAHAEGVFTAIDKAMAETCPGWKEKLIGMGSDGASVNIGKTNSVATRLKEHAPHLVTVHCLAHRLELGALDAMKTKDASEFLKLKDLLQKLHKHYYYSPKAVRELKSLAEMMDQKYLKPGNLKGTRWMAHLRNALKNLTESYEVIVTHFENTVESRKGTAEVQGRAKFILTHLTSYRLMRFMYFLKDVLHVLSVLSLEYQKEGCTLPDSLEATETACLQLVGLTQRPGEHLQNFIGEVDQEMTFKGVKLKQSNVPENTIKNQENALIDAVLCHISRRVDDTKNDLLKSMTIFFPVNHPQSQEELAVYGEDDIDALCTYFNDILDHVGCDTNVLKNTEWAALKTHLRKQPAGTTIQSMYQRLFTTPNLEQRFHNILMLVEIVLCVPVSSSVCERGFSAMARIKSDWRATLTIEMLNYLMGISISGSTLEDYNAERALSLWWHGGERMRRPVFE